MAREGIARIVNLEVMRKKEKGGMAYKTMRGVFFPNMRRMEIAAKELKKKAFRFFRDKKTMAISAREIPTIPM